MNHPIQRLELIGLERSKLNARGLLGEKYMSLFFFFFLLPAAATREQAELAARVGQP